MLGIRPEALSLHLQPSLPTIEIKVDMAERIGGDQLVYGTAGDDAIVARIESNVKVSCGDRIRLGVDVRLVHLFDVRDGQAYT